MMDLMVAQEVGGSCCLLSTKIRQFGISCGPRPAVDHLPHRATVTEDVEIHGGEGTGGSDRTHAETGPRRNQDMAVDDREGRGDVVDEQR